MLMDALILSGLTKSEVKVARLVAKGLANKLVADRLFVSEKTVKFHLTNIYKKMKVKSRSQFIVWCLPHVAFEEKEANQKALEKGLMDFDGATLSPGRSRVGHA